MHIWLVGHCENNFIHMENIDLSLDYDIDNNGYILYFKPLEYRYMQNHTLLKYGSTPS